MDGDKVVGVSTGRIFTWYYRKMISLCTIEPEYAELGRKVEVIWGSEGKRQNRIRAKVARYPYLSEERSSDVDVASIPRGTRD